jgi:hypothetical protein
VLALRTNPAGREGITLYEATVPPLLVGLSGVIATPFVSTNAAAV